MKYEELDRKIHDKKELSEAVNIVCAKCFEMLQRTCEGCPVAEIEVREGEK